MSKEGHKVPLYLPHRQEGVLFKAPGGFPLNSGFETCISQYPVTAS